MPPSTNKSSDDKKKGKHGMKPITLPSVAKYMMNVGKSVGLATVDYLGEISPTTQEFLETNEDLFKEVVSATVNYKQTLKKATYTLKKSKVWEAYTEGKKALFEDLTTGKFYNKEREDKLNASAIGMDIDFGDDDMEFDDSMFSFDDDDSSDTAKQTRILDSSIEVAAKATANVTAQSGVLVADTVKDSAQILFTQNREMMGKVQAGMTGMANILTDINKFMNGPLVTGLQNSKTYQEKALGHFANIEGMLKEITEMQRNLYNAKQQEYKEEGYNAVFDSDGIPDLAEYGKQVAKNMKNFLGPEFDMFFGNSFGKDANGLLMLVSSPLKFIPEMLIKKIIPATIKKSMETLDQSLSGIFSTIVSRITNMGGDAGDLSPRSILARILGLDIKLKESVDTSKFKKGPTPFDGETRQTIIKVIPGYLARIEAALTGGMERIYDLGTGKWTNISKIHESYVKRKENSYKDSWGDAAQPVQQHISRLKNVKNTDGTASIEAQEQAAAIEKAFDNILKKVYEDKGEFIGYKQKRGSDGEWQTAYDYYGVDEESYKTIMKLLSGEKNRKNMTKIARSVMSERDSWNEYLKSAEQANSVLTNLFDKSYDVKSDIVKTGGVGYKGGVANFLIQAVDESGKNIFFYLREMLGNLMNIADHGVMGGGRNREERRRNGNYNPVGARKSAAQRVEELLKARNRVEREEQKPDDGKEKKEHKEKTLAEINEELEKARIEAEKELEEDGAPMKDEDVPKDDRAFLTKLREAETVGGKMKVIQGAIDSAMKKPALVITSMLDTADRKLYEMLFGKEELMNLDKDRKKTPQGVVDMILIKMEESFDNFNDWLKETIMNPVKKWMDETGITAMLNKVKDKAKDAWDWTKDKLHINDLTDALKRKFNWGKDQVTDAFDLTAMDLANASGHDLFNRLSPSYNKFQSLLGMPDRGNKNLSLAASKKKQIQDSFDAAIAAGMVPREALAQQKKVVSDTLESYDKYKEKKDKKATRKATKAYIASKGDDDRVKNIIAYHQQAIEAAGGKVDDKVQKRFMTFKPDVFYRFIGQPKLKGKLNKKKVKEGLAIYKEEIIYKGSTHKEAIAEVCKKLDIPNPDEPVDMAASGKFVTQRGLALVSPGETILPATYDKAAQKTQLAHEKAYANRFGIKGASYYAEGKPGGDSPDGMAKTVDPKKEEETVWNTIKAVGREVNDAGSIVDTVADMLIGGGASLITGMIGGPLLGAAVGASIGLSKNSATFREKLFGQDMEDGSHKEGLIPKSWQDIASKYLPDVKKYGIVGGVAGLLTPFGLVGGILAGSAIAAAKNNEDVQEFLFGKMQEDGEGNKFRDGGLISKHFRDMVKKAVPNMLIGAAGMALAGPFGLFPNAIMGSSLGLLTSTDKFKDALLGTEGEDGKRHGGVVGALKTGFVDPLLQWGKSLMEETKKWLKETVWDNTKRFLKPFTKMLSNAIGSIVGIIGGFFNEKVVTPIYDVVLHKFLEPIGKVAGKLIKAPLAVGKAIISAPFKMLGAVGDNIRMTQIGKGTADDMTAAERVDFRKKHEGRHIFNAIAGRDKFGRMDRMLLSKDYEGKEGTEKMEKMRDSIDLLTNSRKKLNDKHVELCNKCIQKISDILNSDVVEDANSGRIMSCYTYVKYKNVQTLNKHIEKGQFEEARKEITHGRWNDLPADVIRKILDVLEQMEKPILEALYNKKNSKQFVKKLMKQVGAQTGLTKLKDLNRLKKNLDTEIKTRKKDEVDEEDMSEEQKLRKQLQDEQWEVTKAYLDTKNDKLFSILDHIDIYLADMAGYKPGTTTKEKEANQVDEDEKEYNRKVEAGEELTDEDKAKQKKRELATTLATTMNDLGVHMDRDNLVNFFSGSKLFNNQEVIDKLKATNPSDFFSEILDSPEFASALGKVGIKVPDREALRKQFSGILSGMTGDDFGQAMEDKAKEGREPTKVGEEDEFGPADGYRGWRKFRKFLSDKYSDKLDKAFAYQGYDPDNMEKSAKTSNILGRTLRAGGRFKDEVDRQIGGFFSGIKKGATEGFRKGAAGEFHIFKKKDKDNGLADLNLGIPGDPVGEAATDPDTVRQFGQLTGHDELVAAADAKQSLLGNGETGDQADVGDPGVQSVGGILQGNKQDIIKAMDEGYTQTRDSEGRAVILDSSGEAYGDNAKEYNRQEEEDKEIARTNTTLLGRAAEGITAVAGGLLGKAWNTGKNIVGGIVGGIGSFIDNFGGPVFKVLKMILGGATLIAASGHFAEFWTNAIWNPVLKPFVTEKLVPAISNIWGNAKAWIDENMPNLGAVMDSIGNFCTGLITNPAETIINWFVTGFQKAWDYIVDPLKVAIYQALHATKMEDLYGEKSLQKNDYQEVDENGNAVYIDANGNRTTSKYAADGTENKPSMLTSDATKTDFEGMSTVGDTLDYTLTDSYLGESYALDKYTSGTVVIKNRSTGSYVKFKIGGTKVEFGYELDDDGNPYDVGVEKIIGAQVTGTIAGGVAGGVAAGIGGGALVTALGCAAVPGIGWVVGGIALGGIVIGGLVGNKAGKSIGVAATVYERKNGRKVAELTYNTTDDESADAVTTILHAFGWYGGIDKMQTWAQFNQIDVTSSRVELGLASDTETPGTSSLAKGNDRGGGFGSSNVGSGSFSSGSSRKKRRGRSRDDDYDDFDNEFDEENDNYSGKGHIYQHGLDMAEEKFGNTTIGDAGCGPVTVTNLINRMGGNMNVDTAAKVAEAGGYIDSTGGTTTDYISSMLNSAGMSAQETMDKTSVLNSIKSGNPAVLLGHSNSEFGTPFGAGDHYINAMGMDNSGNIYAEDPDLPQSMVRYRASDVMRDMDVGIMTGAGRSRQRRDARGAVYGQRLTASFRRQGFKSGGRRKSGRMHVAEDVGGGGSGPIEGVTNTIWVKAWVMKAYGIISQEEGGYDSINKADGSAGMSVGKCQWNWKWGRAQPLLYKILTSLQQTGVMTESDLRSKLGDTLYDDIMQNREAGKARKCNAGTEYNGLREVLGTDISKNIQDAQAIADVEAYYTDTVSKYLDIDTQENAVIYMCDFTNQYGGSKVKGVCDKAKTAAGGKYENITLDQIHEACVSMYPTYKSRRDRVYQTLSGSEIVGSGEVEVAAADLGAFVEAAASEASYYYSSGYSDDTEGSGGILAQLGQALTAVFKAVYGDEVFDLIFGSSSNNSTYGESTGSSYVGVMNRVNTAQQALPAWLASKAGQVEYSLKGPQDPDQGSASCASTTWWAYRKALGLTGTNSSSYQWEKNDDRFTTIYNSPRYNNRSSPGDYGDLSKLQPGDVLFYERTSANASDNPHHIGHTAMYAGDGQIWNHGGNPTMGPVQKSIENDKKTLVAVKRYTPFLKGEQVPFTNPDGTPGVWADKQTVADLDALANGEGPRSKEIDLEGNDIIELDKSLPTTWTAPNTGVTFFNPLGDKMSFGTLPSATPTTVPAASLNSDFSSSPSITPSVTSMYDSLLETSEDIPTLTLPTKMPVGFVGGNRSGKGRNIDVMSARNRFMSGKSRFRKSVSPSLKKNMEARYEDVDPGSNISDDDTGISTETYVEHLRTGKSRSGKGSSGIGYDQFLQTIIALLRIIAKESEKTDRIIALLDSIDIHISKSDVKTINTSGQSRENIAKAIRAAKSRKSGKGGPELPGGGTKAGEFGGANARDKNDIQYVIQTLQEFARA